MKYKAKFIGEDGSMGYKRGKVYELSIVDFDENGMAITRPNYCPYSNRMAFDSNWEKVEEEKEDTKEIEKIGKLFDGSELINIGLIAIKADELIDLVNSHEKGIEGLKKEIDWLNEYIQTHLER